MLNRIVEVVVEFRDRDMYDKLSISYVNAGILEVVIKAIVSSDQITTSEYKPVAKIFELCACHTSGIEVMSKYLVEILNMVDVFIRCDLFDFVHVKYPAATVLLDLTASELCIERVA